MGRVFRLSACLVLCLGSARAEDFPPPNAGSPALPVFPRGAALTQSVTTLTAATDAPIGSNLNRRYLCLMNIGTNPVTLAFGQAAVAGQGWALDPAIAAGRQGGSQCWEGGFVPASAVHAISTGGSTLVVLEGS